MITREHMTLFSNYYRLLALLVSDRLSSVLKTNFDMKEFTAKTEPYGAFCSNFSNFTYVGLFRYKSRGVLIFIDPQIIYALSNRLMGGRGVVEPKEKELFTFSEDFFGRELLSWYGDFYKENKISLQFLRVETHLDHIHYFFPDETVATATMKCKMDQKPVGTIAICHPAQFVTKERLICKVS